MSNDKCSSLNTKNLGIKVNMPIFLKHTSLNDMKFKSKVCLKPRNVSYHIILKIFVLQEHSKSGSRSDRIALNISI